MSFLFLTSWGAPAPQIPQVILGGGRPPDSPRGVWGAAAPRHLCILTCMLYISSASRSSGLVLQFYWVPECSLAGFVRARFCAYGQWRQCILRIYVLYVT